MVFLTNFFLFLLRQETLKCFNFSALCHICGRDTGTERNATYRSSTLRQDQITEYFVKPLKKHNLQRTPCSLHKVLIVTYIMSVRGIYCFTNFSILLGEVGHREEAGGEGGGVRDDKEEPRQDDGADTGNLYRQYKKHQ